MSNTSNTSNTNEIDIEKEEQALRRDVFDRLNDTEENWQSNAEEILYDFESMEQMGIDPFSFM